MLSSTNLRICGSCQIGPSTSCDSRHQNKRITDLCHARCPGANSCKQDNLYSCAFARQGEKNVTYLGFWLCPIFASCYNLGLGILYTPRIYTFDVNQAALIAEIEHHQWAKSGWRSGILAYVTIPSQNQSPTKSYSMKLALDSVGVWSFLSFHQWDHENQRSSWGRKCADYDTRSPEMVHLMVATTWGCKIATQAI